MKKLFILIPVFSEDNQEKLLEVNYNWNNIDVIFFDFNSRFSEEINDLFSKMNSFITQNEKEYFLISTSWNVIDESEIIELFNSDNLDSNLMFFNSKIKYENGEDFELVLFRYFLEQFEQLINSNFNSQELYCSIRSVLIERGYVNILNKLSFHESSFYIRVLNNESIEKFKKYDEMVLLNWSYINKEQISKKINNFNKCGINLERRDPQIIISLTSFPERINEVSYCIYSLLNQKFKPDKVILWLAEEQFQYKEQDLPISLLNLRNNGLTIKWCEDIKSYKKLIPALKEYPNDFIVTVDDDIYYHEDWLDKMWNTYKKYPNTIISSRARSIKIKDGILENYDNWNIFSNFHAPSYLSLPTGAGGTLYYPHALSQTVFDENLFNQLCPTADDLWFWAMAVINETKITSIENPFNKLTYVNVAQEAGILDNITLWQHNKEGHNDVQIKNILNHFPEILEIINKN